MDCGRGERRYDRAERGDVTDLRVTQAAIEEWALPAAPALQATQVFVEQWAQVDVLNPQFILTAVLVEQWASVAEAAVASTQARAWIMA